MKKPHERRYPDCHQLFDAFTSGSALATFPTANYSVDHSKLNCEIVEEGAKLFRNLQMEYK